jgi:hypothetical protein
MVEVADRVATEFLVIKIQPKPDFRKPVIDVESGGFRVPWNDKEQHEHGALGGDAKCDWAFPNRLTGPGCATLVNPGNPNNYIKTQCFAVPTAPPSFFTPIASTPLCSSDPALGTSAVGDPTLGQCLNLRGNSGRNILIGPGTSNLDFSLFKIKNNYIKRISENFNVQVRAELFNILNRANFAVSVSPIIRTSSIQLELLPGSRAD